MATDPALFASVFASRAGRILLVLLAATAALAGCAKPKSAGEIADAGGLQGANQKAAQAALLKNVPPNGLLVGTMEWSNLNDDLGVIRLTGAPIPAGTTLITKSRGGNTKAILLATSTARSKTQGVTLVQGVPEEGDDVLIPGSNDSMAVQQSMNWNSERMRDANQANRAAGSAAPGIIPGQ